MATNTYGLDTDYFTRLCEREFSASSISNQTPEDLARAFARAARTACSHVLREEEFNWEPLRSVGQIKAGDKIRFSIDGELITRRAIEILHAGTDREEVLYQVKKNYYFNTCMAIKGSSRHKGVMVRIRAKEEAE